MIKSNKEILQTVSKAGEKRVDRSWQNTLIIGFITAFLAGLGYLAYFRFTNLLQGPNQGAKGVLDVILYPIGATVAIWGGGEMILSTVFYLGIAFLEKKISFLSAMKNTVLVLFSNIAGVVFSSYVFGHLGGFMEGELLDTTIAIANSKITMPSIVSFVGGMGCNLIFFVGVWHMNSTDKPTLKLGFLWLFVMVYYISGFQHAVTNMFTISAGMFTGQTTITIFQYIKNILAVLAGNIIGGIIFITIPYYFLYKKKK